MLLLYCKRKAYYSRGPAKSGIFAFIMIGLTGYCHPGLDPGSRKKNKQKRLYFYVFVWIPAQGGNDIYFFSSTNMSLTSLSAE